MEHYDLERDPRLEPEIGLWIAAMNDSTREWRENLESPSNQAIVWQPYEDAASIGGLLLHIASCEQGWIFGTILGRSMDETTPEAMYSLQRCKMAPMSWPVAPQEPFAWYLDVLARSRRMITDALVDIRDPGLVVRDSEHMTCSVRWILSHLVQHDAYHGGQCVTLAMAHDVLVF